MSNFSNKDNTFYLEAKVLLEGVEIPYNNVSISYGIDTEPSCTISMPGSSILKDLPLNTKVLVLYKNFLENSSKNTWYVLFEGELENVQVANDYAASTMTINAIHSTKYLNLMQLLLQEATAKAVGMENIDWGGGLATCNQISGNTYADSILLEGLFPEKGKNENFETMADLVYCLIKVLLNEKLYGAATTGFFRNKICNTYKLPDRIFNVSSTARKAVDKIISKMKERTLASTGSGQKIAFDALHSD